MEDKLNLSKEEWRNKLTEEEYHILREKGTERPFSGLYNTNFDKGVYHCAGCGEALFTSDQKFDSHCGWPSFDGELPGGVVAKHRDISHGMIRTEITCAKCDGHLGHIFDDGPTASGVRYCVNSVSIKFKGE